MSNGWFILASAALLSGLWRSRSRASAPEKLIEAILPVLLVGLLYAYAETAALAIRWTWSACRLAPVIGLLHGYPLYSPADTGPINGWLYGPVAAIGWLPAGLASSPSGALTIAVLINLAFLLAPLFLAGRMVVGIGPASALLGPVAGAAGLLLVYPTWYMASSLNADAIAVGLGASSCLLLQTGRAPGGGRMCVAALLAAFAVWTKQVEAPLVLAQLAWLWFEHGVTSARRYAAAAVATMLIVTGLVCLLFPVRDVFFNLWTVPAAQARPGGWVAAWNEVPDFVRYTAVFWLPCALVYLIRRRPEQARSTPPAASPNLFLAAAIMLLPFGILATIKIGGDRNSIHSTYYLVVAAVISLLSLCAGDPPRRLGWSRPLVAMVATLAVFLAVRQVANYPNLTMIPSRCLSDEAWDYDRHHQGKVYFPWDPLATLLAEGRMYSFEYGVLDRIYAGIKPDGNRIRRDLPAGLTLVVYPRADYPRVVVKEYLPEFIFSAATGDWLIYRRKPDRNDPAAVPVPSPPSSIRP